MRVSGCRCGVHSCCKMSVARLGFLLVAIPTPGQMPRPPAVQLRMRRFRRKTCATSSWRSASLAFPARGLRITRAHSVESAGSVTSGNRTARRREILGFPEGKESNLYDNGARAQEARILAGDYSHQYSPVPFDRESLAEQPRFGISNGLQKPVAAGAGDAPFVLEMTFTVGSK